MTTLPGPTLGVVGAGQLGRMLAEAAAPLGVEVAVSDPTEDAPAAPVAREQLVGGFDDRETFRRLAERVDVLTFEIELVDPELLQAVSEETNTPVHPNPETLSLIEDKLVQKRRMEAAGVPVPPFRAVEKAADVYEAAEELGYPLMLKARMGGYDGRGNVAIEDASDVEPALEQVAGPAMVEGFVDYERELAIMGVKGDGEIDTFPVTETIHREEILRETVAPARTDEGTIERAEGIAHDVLAEMSGRGVYGIELFEGSDGDILLNEIAPRPHNSGHWTIEGCVTSQFEQHVRAVLGWPLGSTERRCPTVSANILGDVGRQKATLYNVDRALEADGCHLHYYGKDEVYELRKMGHLTRTGADGADPTELLEATRAVRDELTFDDAAE
ncbi:5-(carboxyamino)imidazole ribonucleotide synthase [Halobacteria archaeon HArc-curdl5-1]|uniref:N5-carboxyaminoimidazole ribonucleotide synthase n=1 Tax=Halapricum hydrolyticum TaxID=2979991 RepID=A0AAE3LFX1_9EURY|nr:5-(carboxyamino)imidazole ribonucleotide synthase [Halapricum hydrolyticum]MCU4719095.1 5-(carboxyamino)imidazole ribonucleotide synthase [Halapricum hydrolyticum]MCU4728132.1 5-(carboxyamino)imidazole ribonucleotide synthase [Halapricum hydrolyticum]